MLENIKNLIDDLGEDVEVELVVNGGGIKLFLQDTSPIKNNVQTIVDLGVKIAVCRNSMRHFELEETAFLKVVNFVPSGVGELTRKQTEGWSYIRP